MGGHYPIKKGPHGAPLRGFLPPEGALPSLGRPGGGDGPHGAPLRGFLPPEGALRRSHSLRQKKTRR